MAQDTALLRYLLKGARRAPGSGSQRDLAFAFDGTNDYISSNTTIGRTGYDMNVSGNVSTGSDGDGSYFWINGNRNGIGTEANIGSSANTTPAYTQANSFTIKAKFKFSAFPVSASSGLFGSSFDAVINIDSSSKFVFGLRGSTTVLDTSTAVSINTLYDGYLVYDSATTKFYGYLGTSGGASVLLNPGGTTGPATFLTNNWVVGDASHASGSTVSCNKYIYHAAIRNKALTQAEIDADIALGNTTKNDPSIVAYYIPENLQYNTQYLTDPKALNNASWTKSGGAVVTADTTVAPDGTTTADTLTLAVAGDNAQQLSTTLSGSNLASKTFILKCFAKVAAATGTFRLGLNHNGVTSTSSSNFTATTDRQEFTLTVTNTSSTSGTGMLARVQMDNVNTPVALIVRNVRLYLVNETLRDESPNIGGFIGWKTQKVLSCRYKPAADFADSATAGALMVIPRAYMHDRVSDHKPQIRYDDRIGARTSIAIPLGSGFRGKVHVLGVIYRTGSAFATKFYTNGVLVDSDTRIALPPSSFIQSILESGRRSTTYFSGNIREQRIYTFTGSFTNADALAIYNGGEPTSAGVTKYLHYKPPVGELGTTTQDQSTNDRDGTLNGGVTRNYI